MSTRIRFNTTLVFAAALVGAARADLTSLPAFGSEDASAPGRMFFAPDSLLTFAVPSGLPALPVEVSLPDDAADRAARGPRLAPLPPGPDSATLLVYALSGLGLWQLGRSARKFDVGFSASDLTQLPAFDLADAAAWGEPPPAASHCCRLQRSNHQPVGCRQRLWWAAVAGPRAPPMRVECA